MADYPIKQLGNKTPLQVAKKPNIDKLARWSVLGMAKTVPDNMKPGSDIANLAVMGYNPQKYYTGRSPLEAVSIGINLKSTDIAFRCNFVTLSDEADYNEKTMIDYSSDEITTEEAAKLIEAVNSAFKTDEIEFYAGISYRHCMIWHGGKNGLNLTPPHDISDKKIKNYVPKNNIVYNLMEKSYDILKNHPVNLDRIKRGLHPANSIWLWGEGTKPAVSNFYEEYGKNGSVISAVDLIKGIGICAGLNVVEVEGATGNINTNFDGKAEAALKELLSGREFVYIHVEAPDECGHRGEIENKVKSIELIDEKIVGPLIKGLEENNEEYSILVMPDHPTPISLKTHVSDPVPFLMYRSNEQISSGVDKYDEESAEKTGLFIYDGYKLMDLFLNESVNNLKNLKEA